MCDCFQLQYCSMFGFHPVCVLETPSVSTTITEKSFLYILPLQKSFLFSPPIFIQNIIILQLFKTESQSYKGVLSQSSKMCAAKAVSTEWKSAGSRSNKGSLTNSFPKAKRPFPIVVHIEFIQIILLPGSRTAQSH